MIDLRSSRFVIVGGGLAGAEAALTLRNEGFEGAIVLVGDEPHPPYDRPSLSKEYLRGESAVDRVMLRDPAVYRDRDIEFVTGKAVELHPSDRQVVLAGGRRLGFDRLLLATGSRARPFPGQGASNAVHLLRTIDDADAIRQAAASASSAIVAGGGWVAAETAASLRQLGLDVTLVVPGRGVLAAALGPEVSAIYTALHRDRGVRVVENNRVGDVVTDGSDRAAGVRLMGGDVLRADLVVLGFGALPNVDLAAGAGLDVRDGVVVDERLETSFPGIFAAGDVASARHPRYGTHIRSEHRDNAARQGAVAARNMLGRGESYLAVPFFYSDQFDLGMEWWGRREGADDSFVRQLGDGAFVAFWLRHRRVIAGMHGNAWDVSSQVERLVASAADLDSRHVEEALEAAKSEGASSAAA